MRRLRFAITAAIALSICVAGVCAIPWQGRNAFERWREARSGSVVSCAQVPARDIALTFDDGPDPRYTPRILDILKQRHAHATFFVLGRRLLQAPDLGRRILRDGNAIGNHTDSHAHLDTADVSTARREIVSCDRAIVQATGTRTRLFRPPLGVWSPATFACAVGTDHTIVLWSVAFDRVRVRDEDRLGRRLLDLVRPGDIVLMHDGSASRLDERGSTVRQLPRILDNLQARGYRFLTIPELLHIPTDEATTPPAPVHRKSARSR